MFAQLCRDDTPMVRRAASVQLGKLAPLVDVEILQTELVPLFTSLADDDQVLIVFILQGFSTSYFFACILGFSTLANC